jgi:transcription initiation factor TFIIH subunit 3
MHLAVVLDLSKHWLDLQQTLPFSTFLSHLQAFLNAYKADSTDSSLAVFAAAPGRNLLLYSDDEQQGNTQEPDPNAYSSFSLVASSIVQKLSRLYDELDSFDEPCPLVGTLVTALCHINKAISTGQCSPETDEPRILILSVSPDLSTSYIPIMNSIFSAQKLKVTIDVCQLCGPETVFLQQASHLTGGSYIQLESTDALVQYLTMAFLPPPSIRNTLAVPTQDKVDFRAACFCHKNIVDVGYVCSVCLSIFCHPIPVCSTCRTKFPAKLVLQLRSTQLPDANGSILQLSSARPTPAPPTAPDASLALNSLPNSNSIATSNATSRPHKNGTS